ncbi:MAG: glycosyl hydrolase [Chloroflexota bacterium]|nr:glycosyl hydrolase [Chloroflexota bacterium]MDQ5864645.1 glycosyl hydrolase [Chloroflexota bacterium]
MRAFQHTSRRRTGLFAALMFVIASCLSPFPQYPHETHAAGQEGRFYEATGFTLAPEFVAYYDAHGGVPLFGYPVTAARMEGGYLVQWTERQRLEHHPEHHGTPFEVLLGLLGRELTAGYTGPSFRAAAATRSPGNSSISASQPADAYFFAETGQTVAEPFLSYWRDNGGLPVFGYPISSLHENGQGLQQQWFERARFEYHPELAPEHQVLLGHLGLEARKAAEVPRYELQVDYAPTPDGKLEIGLAQGGESEDAGFFDNIREVGRELGPGLVRIDNIYNHFGIVGRAADGKLTYNWGKFDRVLDGIKAMGKEPFICLSYMPETMSVTGSSRVVPPARYEEWAELVAATVRHVNVERQLGVRYWEVWNEPNLWDFWQGSYQQYLRLYDVTVEAAIKVDPSIRIGGPAVASYQPDHIDEFMQHEARQGQKGRVDFVSWHSYGKKPEELAGHIRAVRAIAAKYPQFSPELIITEFNVLQGGAQDTSANGATDTAVGAIAFLSSIETMQRERLDKALLFELKDGAGPRSYWGRWGMLTNDGLTKPIYHAYKAYQTRPGGQLPVRTRNAPSDGSLGLLAYGNPSDAALFLWYTGDTQVRVKVALPDVFAETDFDVTLFDRQHNNPARTGDSRLTTLPARNAGDLVLELQPNSLVILRAL